MTFRYIARYKSRRNPTGLARVESIDRAFASTQAAAVCPTAATATQHVRLCWEKKVRRRTPDARATAVTL